MGKRIIILISCFFLSGCAGVSTPGSKAWHANRLLEIESSYEENKISHNEYIQLKNEADQVRATRSAG